MENRIDLDQSLRRQGEDPSPSRPSGLAHQFIASEMEMELPSPRRLPIARCAGAIGKKTRPPNAAALKGQQRDQSR